MTTNSQGPAQGPTWYDILGVEQSATPQEIKAAWRNATDKFEPGTGASQFRLFNEAADVLLDPVKRTAYDAGLAPQEAPAVPAEVPEVPEAAPETAPEAAVQLSKTVVLPPADESQATPVGPSTRLVAAVIVTSVLAVAMVVVVVFLGRHVEDRVQAASAGSDASSVAERALTAVLSYNYTHMDADRNRAETFLTPAYRKQYVKTFSLLTVGPNGTPGGAEKTKAVVTANVLNSGVVDSGADLVRVLVFVNQTSVKGTSAPAIFQNRVVATMVKSGNSWLVSDITSY